MEKSIYSDGYTLFLEMLRGMRKSAGLTQIELAARLGSGATQSFVSKCERGERRIDVVELRAFCRAIGVPFDDFARRLEDALAEPA